MVNILKYQLVFLILVFCTGCVCDEANRCYEHFSPKSSSEVEILNEAPQTPYTVVGDLQAGNSYFLFFKWATSPEYIRKRAAEIGADAVIISHLGGYYSRDEVWAGKDRHSDSQSRIIGTAIKYNSK